MSVHEISSELDTFYDNTNSKECSLPLSSLTNNCYTCNYKWADFLGNVLCVAENFKDSVMCDQESLSAFMHVGLVHDSTLEIQLVVLTAMRWSRSANTKHHTYTLHKSNSTQTQFMYFDVTSKVNLVFY